MVNGVISFFVKENNDKELRTIQQHMVSSIKSKRQNKLIRIN